MGRYEYLEEVKTDLEDYIANHYEQGDTISKSELYDDAFNEDSITGNASGSYYCNSYKAWESLGWCIDELVEEMEFYFGEIPTDKRYNWEWLDVSVRCMLLGEAIAELKKEYEDVYNWED